MAVALAEKMAEVEEGWDGIKDKETFADAFLDAHMSDPNVGEYCRKTLGGDKVPPLFALPEDPDIEPPPAKTPAKKVRGYLAECARSAAERGEDKVAIEHAMQEMLEYGDQAISSFEFAREVQDLKKYAELVETAKEIDSRGRALLLVDEGLYPVEAMGEAQEEVARDYAITKLSLVAEQAITAKDKVVALEEVAKCLATASGNTAAHQQISNAPLATLSAIAALRESVGMLEVQQKDAADEDLDKGAATAHKAALACKDHLVDRSAACEARIKAEDVAELAKKAASKTKKAAEMPVKNMADMKKMQEAFIAANKDAIKACELATDCANYISKQKEQKPNDEAAEALFAQIEQAFTTARAASTEDVLKRAKAAAEEQAQAKEISDQVMEDVAKEKEALAAKGDEEEVAAPAVDKDQARTDLLAAMKEFSSKRWDTNLATQTLKRLTDRRKEVIGQLWEAVETEDARANILAEKFVDQFNNTMDARRRLDAVVRLMGRGESLDPRTSKWFIDGIMKLAEAAASYKKAHA